MGWPFANCVLYPPITRSPGRQVEFVFRTRALLGGDKHAEKKGWAAVLLQPMSQRGVLGLDGPAWPPKRIHHVVVPKIHGHGREYGRQPGVSRSQIGRFVGRPAADVGHVGFFFF